LKIERFQACMCVSIEKTRLTIHKAESAHSSQPTLPMFIHTLPKYKAQKHLEMQKQKQQEEITRKTRCLPHPFHTILLKATKTLEGWGCCPAFASLLLFSWLTHATYALTSRRRHQDMQKDVGDLSGVSIHSPGPSKDTTKSPKMVQGVGG